MLAQDSEWMGWSNTTAVATARAAAIQTIPELEGYQWMDGYFDQSAADIIAVFDHDAFLITANRLLVLVLVVLLCAYVQWERYDDYQYNPQHSTRIHTQSKECNLKPNKSVMTAFFVMVLIGWIVHIKPPHTAVTMGGVLHVTGGSLFLGGPGTFIVCYLPFLRHLSEL